MGRAELRRNKKLKIGKTPTYNLTKEQLEQYFSNRFESEIAKAKEEAVNDAVNTAMTLLLTLPLEVLMDHYWKKTYRKKLPEFTEHVIDYYQKYQNGELDMDKMIEDLWEYGGIKLVTDKELEVDNVYKKVN